ncbi:TIR domain-containing protein [Sphingomonas flavescens]|uniref:TIR domain-containing protein n=1 Tax=Sphingomonas flavescens TaxID=3132797 RepID=UPI00280385D3|nr:TIR domain-containing protein [Sphingomonas limnosediminicola]
MTGNHVFISYARADEPLASRIADQLRSHEFEVWRDDELPVHRAYAEVIEERIVGAKAVLVLWSAEAAKSQWVRAEADSARSRLTLVQATLDGTIPPLPFNQIQCADLKGWDGEPTAPGWRKLVGSVSELAGTPATTASKRSAARELSVCVLPFQNMSGDPEQEYFSDGISEDITTDLSQVSALEVIARNTAFTFKGRSVNVCEVARELEVTHVLEGSVRKVGDRVRINAQLIDGRTGGHVWAERYDRDLTDIFTIQDEISEAIVKALKLKLLPQEKKAIEQRRTSSPEAYNLYLLARQYWVTGNHGDVRREERVMRICSRAVEIDPYYADAWALLAIAQSSLCYQYGREMDDGFAAANAALSIDPSIPQARLPIVRRLLHRGEDEKAAAEMEAAIRNGEDSWEVNREAGRFFLNRREVERATHHYERAVELVDDDFHTWAMLSTCYRAQGDTAKLRHAGTKMISEARRAVQQDPSNGAALGILAGGHALLGEKERTREWIERAMLVDPDNLNMRYNFACVLAGYVGDKDAAIKMLASTLPLAPAHVAKIAATDPDLDPLRDDPRFAALLEQSSQRHEIDQPQRVS